MRMGYVGIKYEPLYTARGSPMAIEKIEKFANIFFAKTSQEAIVDIPEQKVVGGMHTRRVQDTVTQLLMSMGMIDNYKIHVDYKSQTDQYVVHIEFKHFYDSEGSWVPPSQVQARLTQGVQQMLPDLDVFISVPFTSPSQMDPPIGDNLSPQ